MLTSRPALRIITALLALAVIITAWIMVIDTGQGVEQRQLQRDGVPVTLLLPNDASHAPGVVVAHGFAGSAQLMRSWGLALADAGFVVALPDLSGHGRNRAPLDWWNDPEQFQRDVQSALALLGEQPEVDARRLSLLGHSLGAGAVIDAAMDTVQPIQAVVAVSPGQSEVTPSSPPNLLLMAGAWEGPFLEAAQNLLEKAGGPGGDPTTGTARALEVVPGVEHIGVLFSPQAHAASIQWLAQVSEISPQPATRVSPMLWWLLNLVGIIVLWRALAPLWVDDDRLRLDTAQAQAHGRTRRPLVRAAISGALATLLLIGIGEIIYLDGIGGILVSPQFALWLALAGGIWLALGTRPPRPEWPDLAWGPIMLGVLVLGFGVMGAALWLAWWPPLHRLPYLPILTLLILPWAIAFATALQGRAGWRGLGVGLGVALITMVTVGVAAALVDGMMFLLIILPLLPVMLALPLLVSRPVQRPWADGFALAAFLGWTLTVMFPLI
ncbi:hypothetical protein M911_08270 [Ectothiorhodospira haloalkaliphila]|uniref:Serine aminopeptidase S33 domain-containing protein n=1 Tax=Ectothiorhodospira haloalkaliphila TaxID=421628 RepID=W8LA49_9GAMM|nr:MULTISPECIES: alpha/beta fold hydrolase [Ectothiorhodospira]AHK80680.1 hypothetical protein M911_08270 [Ectothiorhodospira haloalkaliphila]MCG5495054.1 alpha/beta hydrolase [Ectothiorhodospira variabilis]MCG5504641.1 alpha/beta hydrolase [Ectothiorhodospira variabilis]MCG5507806.1 alpha/beta hydrolase [Ectothiorhodospira variabilis]MCG5525730.1 alpha/beta hydrolase [Ectothiorhodospira haloalkaliphila]